MNPPMKSESLIIIELLVLLALFGVLSFYQVPVYEKGAWLTISMFASLASLVLGYKFGRSMPQQAGDARSTDPAAPSPEAPTPPVAPPIPPDASAIIPSAAVYPPAP